MIKCDSKYLDRSFEGIKRALSHNPNFLASLEVKYNQLRESFNVESVDFCFRKYITAELDCHTLGVRGLGRISTAVPRLGGRFRRQMSRLDESDMSKLYELIQDAMLRGYLTHALLFEYPVKRPKHQDESTIYNRWLRVIYTSGTSNNQNMTEALIALSDSALVELLSFFNEHDMKPGLFGSNRKVKIICNYYPIAGLCLRAIEVDNSE